MRHDVQPWQCSSIGVALQVASRLAPLEVPAATPHAVAHEWHSNGANSDDVSPGSCTLCAPVAAVQRLPSNCIDVLAMLPGGTKGVMSLADLFANPTCAVEIGVGCDCRVYAGVLNKAGDGAYSGRMVAVKVVTIRGPTDHPPAVKRMAAVHREAAVCAAIARSQSADASLTNRARLLATFFGVVASGAMPHSGTNKTGCSGVHSIALVHEYCDLGTLDQLIHRRRRVCGASRSSLALPSPLLTEREVASILGALCNALDFLHTDMRLLHRDVKPQNIFLASVESDTDHPVDHDGSSADPVPVRVVLGDLGLSRTVYGARTTCGTPKFMAPEVVVGNAEADAFPSIANAMRRQCSPRVAVSAAEAGVGCGSASASASPARPPPSAFPRSCKAAGGYNGAADVFSLGVTVQCALSGGASEALRVPWVLPGAGTGRSHSQCHGVNHRGGVAAFVVPAGWYCNASAATCRCSKLHRPTIELINQMIHPDASKRPTARSVRNHEAVLRHTYHVTTLLRDHLVPGRCCPLPQDTVGRASPGVASVGASLDGRHEAKWLYSFVVAPSEAAALRSLDVHTHCRQTPLSSSSPHQLARQSSTVVSLDRKGAAMGLGVCRERRPLTQQQQHGAQTAKRCRNTKTMAPATFHDYVDYFSPQRMSSLSSASSG